MKYCYSQKDTPETTLEKMNEASLVETIGVSKLSEKVMDMKITSHLIQAGLVGYSYKNDKEIPEQFDFADLRHANLEEKIDFMRYIIMKKKEFKKSLTESKTEREKQLEEQKTERGKKEKLDMIDYIKHHDKQKDQGDA